MKIPKNIYLGGALILLICLAWFYQGPYKDWSFKKNLPVNPLATLNTDTLNSIEITKGSSTAKLKKTDGVWYVDSNEKVKFKVTKTVIDPIVEKLAEAKKANLQLISNNQDKQKEYELTDDKSTQIKLTDNKNSFEVVLGKTTSDYMGSFVTTKNNNKTYKFSAINLSALFGRDDWRDLTIFSQGEKKATSMRIQYQGKKLELTKTGENWVAGKTKYNTASVEKIATAMANLFATRIPEQNFKPAGLEKPEVILEVKGDGFDNTLMIGKKNKDGLFYAKTGEQDNLYLINKNDHDILTTQENKLK